MDNNDTNERKILDVKIASKVPKSFIAGNEQQQLNLQLENAEEINNLFAEKQLKKQDLKRQISLAKKDLNCLEKQLNEMAVNIENKQTLQKH